MKIKFILSLLLLLTFVNANAHTLGSDTKTSVRVEISMYSNDIPFDMLTTGEEAGSRSAFPLKPIAVLLDESDNSIVLDFQKAIGDVEIIISLNGVKIYCASENVQSAMQRFIDLPSEAYGNYFIEIKGKNGACVYGDFSL